ncbi:MAG: hypothetical protein GTO63_22230 [Anaerolineae bacterium]|nr:hypothetical protein [Anaerolineae bacterium]NIN97499.1 hypothetical protein [Anaerolineae bacterium]NIQ80428.1 hypothetical protein [Anaerolineae bacterium]
MDCSRSVARLRPLLRVLIICALLCPTLIAGRPPYNAEAAPSAECRTISFAAGHDVGTSADHVRSVALGDLDDDGDLDIVSGSRSGEDYEIIAWQNDGTAFSGPWSTTQDVGLSTAHVMSVALGDLDNDGDLDIVSGSSSGEDYEVIAWQNDGTPFTDTWTPNDVGASDDSVSTVALGDLDNDGDLDIVSGSGLGEDYEVVAWLNAGSPFSGVWGYADVGTSTSSVLSLALGDLDDDGYLDIVSGSGSGEDNEVITWQNDGSPFSGGLWSQQDVGANTANVRSVALGDLDHDGDLDIVSGSGPGENYEIIAWQNDGSPFSEPWTQNNVGASLDTVTSLALGDLDHDGDLDIVSGSGLGEDYEVIAWQNDGSPFATLWTQNDVGASTDSVFSVALGDLDNDGDLDIVSGSGSGENYELIAWQNTLSHRGLGFYPGGAEVGATTVNFVYSVAAGDLDDDGDLDIVSGSSAGEDYEVIAWENDGSPFSGLWPQSDVGASTGSVFSVALGDLDNDGDLDIVSGSGSGEDNEVIAWQNDGSPFLGLWSQQDVGADTATVWSVSLGDLDNDGDLDIVSGSTSGEVIAWKNGGSPFSGLWTQNDVGASTAGIESVALGDLDADGHLDIVSGSGSGEDKEVIAWQNDGSPFLGLWSQRDVGASADSVRSVAPGDLDLDGDLDVVSSSGPFEDYEVIAWDNLGSPVLALWFQNDVGAVGTSVVSIALGDLDHDGDLDVVSGGDSGVGHVIAWQNDGSPFTGLWSRNDVGAVTAWVFSVALGDLDHDGDLDIVSGSSDAADYEIMAWRNRTSDCLAFLPLTLKNYTP